MVRSEFARRAGKLLLALALTYGAVVVVFALLQRSLLYFPTRATEAQERRVAAQLGIEPVESRRGDLLGFRAKHPHGAEATLIVAHGNAGSALDRMHLVDLARDRSLRYEVLLVEYPGYGSRRGEPSEAANVAAVVEAIDLADRGGKPIVLLGESLGSAVVSLAAAERRGKVSALLLVTPLPRLARVASHHYPFLPTALLADRYEADAAIERFGGPVAFVVAGQDEVIPTPLALAMHDGYRGPKLLELDARATHNTLDYEPARPHWNRVFDFLAAATRPR